MSVKCVYSNHLCNSLYEARWYSAFDSMGIRWQSERETENVGETRYRPDVLFSKALIECISPIPIDSLWGEIKGMMDQESEEKVWSFQMTHPILVLADIPHGRDAAEMIRMCKTCVGTWQGRIQPYTLYYRGVALTSGMPCVDTSHNLRLVGSMTDPLTEIDLDMSEYAYTLAATRSYEKVRDGR